MPSEAAYRRCRRRNRSGILGVLVLFQREPLHFDAAVLRRIGTGRFFPAPADGFEPLGVDLVLFHQDATNLFCAFLTELHRLEGLRTHQLLSALLPKLRDPSIDDMTAQ